MPDNVTSIGDAAFAGCSSLDNVIIPDSVTNLGWNAFGNCTSLAKIILPNSITIIERELLKLH